MTRTEASSRREHGLKPVRAKVIGESPYLAEIEKRKRELAEAYEKNRGTFTTLKPSEILVDDHYQRGVDMLRVRKMAADFDMRQFQPFTVVLRPDNNYYAVDGQHRLEAAKMLELPSVPVMLYASDGPEDEAYLFAALQRNRRGLLAHQAFNARVFAGEQGPVEIKRIVNRHGFEVLATQSTYAKAQQDVISATATLEEIYKQPNGRDLLDQTLDVLRRVFHGREEALRAHFIRGIAEFFRRYGDSPLLDRKSLYERLSETAIEDLLGRAANMVRTMRFSQGYAVCMTIVQTYNFRRAEQNRLPESVTPPRAA